MNCLPMMIGMIGTGTGAPIPGVPRPAPPPTGQIVSDPLAPILGTTPPPTGTGANRGAGIGTPWILPSDGTGAGMPTIVHPPISTVKTVTPVTQVQPAAIFGSRTPGFRYRETETHEIETQQIENQGTKIHETWASASPWQPALISPAVTGIGIPRSQAPKSGAVPRVPRIPGTMAPECLDVTSLC